MYFYYPPIVILLFERWFLKYMFTINSSKFSIVTSKILHIKVTQFLLSLIRNSRRLHQLKPKTTKFHLKYIIYKEAYIHSHIKHWWMKLGPKRETFYLPGGIQTLYERKHLNLNFRCSQLELIWCRISHSASLNYTVLSEEKEGKKTEKLSLLHRYMIRNI